jgi:hypothetical protein
MQIKKKKKKFYLPKLDVIYGFRSYVGGTPKSFIQLGTIASLIIREYVNL